MIITPTPTGLEQLVKDYQPLFGRIKNYGNTIIRQRILSVLYFLSDAKSTTLGSREFSAMYMAFGSDNLILGMEMQTAFMPLIAALQAAIVEELFRVSGPDAKPNSAFETVLNHAFVGHRIPILMGYKKAFFGGTKPDIQHMPLPLVENIELVLQMYQ